MLALSAAESLEWAWARAANAARTPPPAPGGGPLRPAPRLAALLVTSLLVTTLSGCFIQYPVNEQLLEHGTIGAGGGYRFDNLALGEGNTDSLFVCVAFSGGGMRSSAMAMGAIEKLAALEITWEGERKSLLDEVDVISSVSGGSFTAAYFALHGRERLVEDFEGAYFSRSIDRELVLWGICPWLGWGRFISPNFDRADMAAELYESIYGEHTFRVIPRRRPFLVLQATNLGSGDLFAFTQDEFDLLGSDLGSVPIARAVAASSAYPVLLSPIRLRNYPSPKPAHLPAAIQEALADDRDGEGQVVRRAAQRDRRRWQWARTRRSYVEDAEQHPFVHLIDGGVADNLGVGFLTEAYRSGFIRDRIARNAIKKLIVIVVNARNRPPSDVELDESSPDAYDVLMSTTMTGIDTAALEHSEGLRELLAGRRTPPPGGVDPHFIELNLDDLPDAERRRELLETPTNYSLELDRVWALRVATGELLERHPELRRLLRDAGAGGD